MNAQAKSGADEKEQEDLAFMRERFLRLLTRLSGQKACIQMHENTTVECVIKSCDPDFNNILVKQLHTPRPNEVLNSAILRSIDVISLTTSVKNN